MSDARPAPDRLAPRRVRPRAATGRASPCGSLADRGLVLATAASTKRLYPTQADLDEAATASQDNPVARAFNGPPLALDTDRRAGRLPGRRVRRWSLVGLMALLMVGRLTRSEEESGRLELVRSMPVGRHAPLAARSLVVAAMDVVVGALVTAGLLAQGLPVDRLGRARRRRSPRSVSCSSASPR